MESVKGHAVSGYHNKKALHTCPFDPEMFRLSLPAAAREGMGHHGSNGSGCGTGPPHGFSSESTALRGCGIVIAEWAAAVTAHAAAVTRRIIAGVHGKWGELKSEKARVYEDMVLEYGTSVLTAYHVARVDGPLQTKREKREERREKREHRERREREGEERAEKRETERERARESERQPGREAGDAGERGREREREREGSGLA